jgi:hypothetical protein
MMYIRECTSSPGRIERSAIMMGIPTTRDTREIMTCNNDKSSSLKTQEHRSGISICTSYEVNVALNACYYLDISISWRGRTTSRMYSNATIARKTIHIIIYRGNMNCVLESMHLHHTIRITGMVYIPKYK